MTEMLDPDLVLRAYTIGVFPMSDGRATRDVYWVEPRRRAILPLDRFHLSRSLRKILRSDRYQVSFDRAFGEVVRCCAERSSTWINASIESSYNLLHASGHAHSVEVWENGKLAGGLYGVRLAAAFFGESMFSTRRDASKVALAWLVARLKVGGFRLLDCQFMTEHLRGFGAVEIPQQNYLALLASAVGVSSDGVSSDGAALVGGSSPSSTSADVGDLGEIDRLLDSRATDCPPAGWVIAQLLGQTS